MSKFGKNNALLFLNFIFFHYFYNLSLFLYFYNFHSMSFYNLLTFLSFVSLYYHYFEKFHSLCVWHKKLWIQLSKTSALSIWILFDYRCGLLFGINLGCCNFIFIGLDWFNVTGDVREHIFAELVVLRIFVALHQW